MNFRLFKYLGLVALSYFPATPAFCQGSLTDTSSYDNPVTNSNSASLKANDLFFDGEKAKMHNDSKRAKELFEQFVALVPESAAGYYQLALICDDEKKIEKAEENIKKALALVKDNKWYSEEYASILARQGKYLEAAKITGEIADKESSDANYAMLASKYYEQAQKFPEAIAYIDKALVRGGPDEDIMMQKVQVYLHTADVEKAAGVIRELIAMDPKSGKYYKLLGELYDNNKMPAKGLEVLQSAEKILPGDASIEFGLYEHYLGVKDSANVKKYVRKSILNKELDIETQIMLFSTYLQSLSDSIQVKDGMPLLNELLKQHPTDATLTYIYGDFLVSSQQMDQAIIQYKKALAIKPSNFDVWDRLLSVYSDKKYADSLVKWSEKSIRLFPNQFKTHYYNAVGHYNKKEYAAAIKALNRSLDFIPETNMKDQADIYSFLGEIYNSNKQFSESDKAFDKALIGQPNNASVLNNYSYFLSERGIRLDDAAEMSQKSLTIRPNEATFMDTYGWIMYKKGEYAEAKEYIEKAVNAREKNADATLYEHLGDVYFKLNDKANAVKYWKIAKEKGSENPQLNKMISEEKLYE